MFKLRLTPQDKTVYLYPDPADDHHTLETDLPQWRGTLVGVDIALDRQQTFAALMRLIRDAYGLDVKELRKVKYKKPRFA